MRPLGLAIALLSLATSVAGAQSDTDPRVDRWLERARQLLERGRERPATALLERVLDRTPSDPRLPATIAEGLPTDAASAAALSDEECAARAEWTLGLLGRVEPADTEANRERARLEGWARAVGGEHDAALALVSEAAGVHDEATAKMLRRLAALFVRRDQLGQARRALMLAIRAWSRDPELVADLAAVELARGMAEDAVRLLRSELAHRPEHRLLREDFAGALLAAGRRAEAIRVWRALADEVSEPGDERRMRRAAARAALADERWETARVEARRALGVDGTDGEARLLLGLALIGLERPEPARLALERAGAALGADDLRVQRALAALEGAQR
ncbi:MAG: hypothetical protein JJ863_27205 [Deltaproteobacteria bacterium]|nr:hypothetical protein [Deltaproteobacteria bacterium]